MSERQIKEYYERIEKLLNGANKETYGFAPQEIKNILRSYEELQNQNQELKKQLEEERNKVREYSYKLSNYRCEETYENQQKEFINYLEDEIKRINPKELNIGELNLRLNDIKFTQYLIYKEILQEYKEIIGGKDEKE